MTDAGMRAIRPRAEIFLLRNGWVWPLTALFVVTAAVEYIAWLQPARRAYTEAVEASRAQSSKTPAPAVSTAAPLQDSAAIEQLTRRLIQDTDAAEVVQSMTSLAKQHGVTIPTSEYQRRVNPALGIEQIQVSQATRTGYPQLRRYIEAVLLAHPNASLDQVLVRRDSVSQTQPEARLRWSVSLTNVQSHGSARVQEQRP